MARVGCDQLRRQALQPHQVPAKQHRVTHDRTSPSARQPICFQPASAGIRRRSPLLATATSNADSQTVAQGAEAEERSARVELDYLHGKIDRCLASPNWDWELVLASSIQLHQRAHDHLTIVDQQVAASADRQVLGGCCDSNEREVRSATGNVQRVVCVRR
jgi:hypothetical protein